MWLVRSPGTVSHCTFVRHLHYQRSKTRSRHICSLVPTSLTNCFAEYEQRTLYGALVVTLAMLPRFINCRFIIIILIYYSKYIERRRRNPFHFVVRAVLERQVLMKLGDRPYRWCVTCSVSQSSVDNCFPLVVRRTCNPPFTLYISIIIFALLTVYRPCFI